MGLLEYIIIGATVVGIMIVIGNANNKKSKKDKQNNNKQVKKTEPQKVDAKSEPVKAEPDRSFKITKQSRLSRVSKKALSTNSRTATIEKVFERTPQQQHNGDQDVYVDLLDDHSQELLEKLEGISTKDTKVISVAELKKQIQQTENIEQEPEEYSSANYIKPRSSSFSSDGQGMGLYSNKFMGRERNIISQNVNQKYEHIEEPFEPDEKPDYTRRSREGGRFADIIQSRFPRFNEQPETTAQYETDYSDIIADAILNPKYKLITQKKHKDNK